MYVFMSVYNTYYVRHENVEINYTHEVQVWRNDDVLLYENIFSFDSKSGIFFYIHYIYLI